MTSCTSLNEIVHDSCADESAHTIDDTAQECMRTIAETDGSLLGGGWIVMFFIPRDVELFEVEGRCPRTLVDEDARYDARRLLQSILELDCDFQGISVSA